MLLTSTGVSTTPDAAVSTPEVPTVLAYQTSAKNHCPSARRALAYYRLRHSTWLELRGVSTRPKISQPRGCAHTRWLVTRAKTRSFSARKAFYRWREIQRQHTVRDFRSWPRAVREVQKVFPGTGAWLLSCSDAEGWNKGDNTLWQGYGGQPYSTWLRDSNTVGGPMQFRFGTFTYMWRAAYSYLREREFQVAEHLRDWRSTEGLTRGWRSMIGQALAAGWARFTGEDNSHWSASWGNGC